MADTPPPGFKRLASSERKPPANARQIGPVDPNERIEVSVYLRDPAASSTGQDVQAPGPHTGEAPGPHTAEAPGPHTIEAPGPHMTREEYNKAHSASPDDIAKVEAFAKEHNLTVVSTDPVSRKVALAGTAAAMTSAFATELNRYEAEGRTFRGRSGPLHIPEELDSIVVGVFGLDNRPQARPHFRRHGSGHVTPHAGAQISYTPLQVAQLYDFPQGLNGSGQCIGIIELGGGYVDQDLTTYFQQLGIPKPQVVSVSVDGGKNSPGDPNGADGEVDLDIQVVGSIAPGARIAVYFAPDASDRSFIDAVNAAIHDTTNNPSVISISWGGPESEWTAQSWQTMDQAFQAAATLGITVCAAAGDNGSGDGVTTDQLAHVDFPASDPYVLGCGGTKLTSSSEVVWNETAINEGATGGGVSDLFGLPSWQANAHVPPSVNDKHAGRGVPDVAGDADPATGYQILVDGQQGTIGGTSAVAPLWAGLLALVNQKRGKPIGYLNPLLYQNYQQLLQNKALRDITSGNNGSYSAGPGWDACTGLGSPDGANLLNTLMAIGA
jgi:kumamolisin